LRETKSKIGEPVVMDKMAQQNGSQKPQPSAGMLVLPSPDVKQNASENQKNFDGGGSLGEPAGVRFFNDFSSENQGTHELLDAALEA